MLRRNVAGDRWCDAARNAARDVRGAAPSPTAGAAMQLDGDGSCDARRRRIAAATGDEGNEMCVWSRRFNQRKQEEDKSNVGPIKDTWEAQEAA